MKSARRTRAATAIGASFFRVVPSRCHAIDRFIFRTAMRLSEGENGRCCGQIVSSVLLPAQGEKEALALAADLREPLEGPLAVGGVQVDATKT
jgi:hypothetical protein